MGAEHADVTEDAVLGGRLALRQPRAAIVSVMTPFCLPRRPRPAPASS